MNDLIARLEAATGPDRELDTQIALAIGVVPVGAFRPCSAEDVGTFATDAYGFWMCDRYTGSIESALALVPEGLAWRVGCEIDLTPTAGVWGHEVHSDEYAATPAIALCIAALKASAQQSAAPIADQRERQT